ncbi:hypothetical protein N825_27645 [Skermanella stibiiresistens SB22]|uniref:Uncharacterized protein n=1 Tax=Skermanella stibiiresistens SB22 TaxID=1385369 RepID=W9H9R8_9PROT|nr:hypothetical protein [Skermanella stibiiresistens]EWY41496.1 hypothetical protein N825_27645 [Skermanella stibiiresistens SB22]
MVRANSPHDDALRFANIFESQVGDIHSHAQFADTSDLERDLSTVLFFFEAYMRPAIWTEYSFKNAKRSNRF